MLWHTVLLNERNEDGKVIASVDKEYTRLLGLVLATPIRAGMPFFVAFIFNTLRINPSAPRVFVTLNFL